MFAKIAKWVALLGAKIASQYLTKVALWAIKLGATKTADSEKVKKVLSVVEKIAEDAALVAKVMKDGTITIEEEMDVAYRTEQIAAEIQELL